MNTYIPCETALEIPGVAYITQYIVPLTAPVAGIAVIDALEAPTGEIFDVYAIN